ncbi:vesicle transport through interaction with t-SNAREs homolog 1B [Euwallacea similis]|uniref:vesicle transport through interaction with t-SNAREs homolog 1B n=1 Tax=Euwallacea similis TaxID=1736056 RepID=UPI003450051C
MFPQRPTYDWDAHNRQVLLEGTQALERTGESIARSHQIAIETENIGTEVVSELGEQRETLLRTRDRLEEANSQLDSAKGLITKMGRNVLYNKVILIVIIALEAVILGALSYIRFFKR